MPEDIEVGVAHWLFVQNFGNTISLVSLVVSIIGMWLTVKYSRNALRAADAARRASNETREQVGRLDILQELTDAIRKTEDLARHTENRDWPAVSERSAEVRIILVKVLASRSSGVVESMIASLESVAEDMRTLNSTAHKVRFGKTREPSIPKVQQMLDAQKETLVLAIGQVRSAIGEVSNA